MPSIQRFVQITAAFDPEATRTLGQAFDMACALLGRTPQPTAVREAIAKCIIEAAKAGERDPVRLREAGTFKNPNKPAGAGYDLSARCEPLGNYGDLFALKLLDRHRVQGSDPTHPVLA